MARSNPSSPRTRPTRLLPFIRPNVRPPIPPPTSAFDLPLRMDMDQDSPLGHSEANFRGEHVRNPIEDQSSGFQSTSFSSAEPSNSSARLDNQRRLSTALTPTSSEGTSSERGAATSRATSNLVGKQHRVKRRRHSRMADHSAASIDETLLGQGRWALPQLEPIQHLEFVSGRPFPKSPVPQTQSPYSGFPRSEDSPGGSASPRERRGGRTGGFEKGKAAKVGEMRQIKACLRCLFFRIECDGGEPCGQCQRRMRTWKLPCSRKRLPERNIYLFPDILFKHLEFDKVYAFMEKHTWGFLPGQAPFHLPLTQFLGKEGGEKKYIWLRVREFEPLGPSMLRRPGFLVVDTDEGRAVKSVEQYSPPLAPFIGADREKVEEEVSKTLELWLRRFLDEKGSNWQWYVFPKGVEQGWERNVLGQICGFLDPRNEEHKKLEVAMELTFFNYLLTHSFAVPDEHIEWLYTQKLQHPEYKNNAPVDEHEVVPRAVNVYLAMLVFNKVRLQTDTTLKHINELFASRDDSLLTGTLAFCESLLFMSVLAQLQKSVLDRSKLDDTVYETTITVQDAKRVIKEMEDELATPIIELCVFKLRKTSKKRKAAGAISVGVEPETTADQGLPQFFNSLRKITELCGNTLIGQTQLGEIDENTFGITNVQRLLKRLYDAVLPFFPSAGPSDVVVELEWPGEPGEPG